MPRSDDLYELPSGLPVPADDGACNHLLGMQVPSAPLASTAGRGVDLSALPGTSVVYCYPRTGLPDQDPPAGWDEIPGARGCTPQACAFRDRHAELLTLEAQVFGLSTQDTAYQLEAAGRLHLPFELLSDQDLLLTRALDLPTFEAGGATLIRRLTLIVTDGRIEKVFYPVFPPDKNATAVLAWLHYREACELDKMDEERKAAPRYERALELGLEGKDLRNAILGLGSTYRCIGEYEKSIEMLRRGAREFLDGREFDVFLALALHNTGEHAQAMRLLLRNLAETTGNAYILQYRRALLYYADHLDQTW